MYMTEMKRKIIINPAIKSETVSQCDPSCRMRFGNKGFPLTVHAPVQPPVSFSLLIQNNPVRTSLLCDQADPPFVA